MRACCWCALVGLAASATVVPMPGSIDAKACMGTWYVQRQKPALALLESGAANGCEVYTWDKDAQDCFAVSYTFTGKNGKESTIRQRGWVNSPEGTSWVVAPMIGSIVPPVRLPFIIMDVAPSSHMLCTGGLSSWMYLLTREKTPDPVLVDELMVKVEAAGFDMDKVEVMAQN